MSKTTKKILVIFVIIITILLLSFCVVIASTATTTLIHHERLDTGVIFVWDDGKGLWQNNLSPGSKNVPYSAKLNIGKGDYSNFEISVYEGDNFSFSSDKTCYWNKTAKSQNRDDYNRNYINYAVQFKGGDIEYDKTRGTLTLNETVNLVSRENFDVAYYIRKQQQKEIYDYLGGTLPPNMQNAINQMGLDPSIKGYLYFLPVVITYDETKTVGPVETLKAVLGLPSEVTAGESYLVTDDTILPDLQDGIKFDHSTLEVSYDGGITWEKVDKWDGTKLNDNIKVLTRSDNGKIQLSYDNGKTWEDIKE